MPGFEIFGDEERRQVNDVLETGVLFRESSAIPRSTCAATNTVLRKPRPCTTCGSMSERAPLPMPKNSVSGSAIPPSIRMAR